MNDKLRLTKQLVEQDDATRKRFELGVEDERQMRAWRLFRLNVEARFPIEGVGMTCDVTVCEHAPIVRLIARDTLVGVRRVPPLCREVRIDPLSVQVSAKTYWDLAKLGDFGTFGEN